MVMFQICKVFGAPLNDLRMCSVCSWCRGCSAIALEGCCVLVVLCYVVLSSMYHQGVSGCIVHVTSPHQVVAHGRLYNNLLCQKFSQLCMLDRHMVVGKCLCTA